MECLKLIKLEINSKIWDLFKLFLFILANYLKANCDYWSQAVYDNINPETYVFRIYGRVIVYEFKMDGSGNENLLDFGCGSGGSSKFFASKGFNVYGADQSKVDIEMT